MAYRKVDKGDRVSEYVLLEKLGQGGFGEVWKAEHAQIPGKYVAIKIPTSTESMDFLKREAVFQHQLDHPNIVKTIGLNTQNDPPYFIMEFVEGKNLRQLMLDDGILPPPYAIDIAVQILEGLFYAHSKNIVHKDIKPENVLVEKRRVDVANRGKALLHYVKITDLGLGMFPGKSDSEIVVSEFSRTSGVRLMSGTLFYMSPEQMVPGRTVDARADLYSVGVVLYEMMTGELPLGMDLPSELNPVITPDLDGICKRALSIDRDCRYQNAADMAVDLQRAKEQFLLKLVAAGAPALELGPRGEFKRLTPRSVPIAPPPSPESKPRARCLEWALLALVLGLLGASLWTFLTLYRGAKARREAEARKADHLAAKLGGPLKITSDPDGAEVFINGARKGTTPFEMADATHVRLEVRLSREFYEDRRFILDPRFSGDRKVFAVIDPHSGKEITSPRDATGGFFLERVELKRHKSGLSIETPGLEEVRVFIDGGLYGSTPFDRDNLEAGDHVIRLEKAGMEPVTAKVRLSPKSHPQYVFVMWPKGTVPAANKPGVVQVMIVSDPQGARILINDTERGVTPSSVELPQGEWELRLQKEYYETHREKLLVTPEARAVTITMEKVRSRVTFESEPAGAVVTLDGARVGTTPVAADLVEGGEHKASFASDGYYEFTYPFKVVDSSAVGPIKATLQKIPPGRVSVECEIPTEVFIDGKSFGRSPVSGMTIESGKHRVRVLGIERTVTVEPGIDRKERFTAKDLDLLPVAAGEFVYGAREPMPGQLHSRVVKLPGYLVDKYEVTNAQYARFLEYVQETGDHAKCHPDEGKDKNHKPQFWEDARFNIPNHPVVGVDYLDAYAYAAWAGKRLPTEQEWEKAARGTKGWSYPWGSEWNPSCLNWADMKKEFEAYLYTSPVGSFPQGASPYGAHDMAGNVTEWTAENYDAKNKRVKGGSYMDKEWTTCFSRWYESVSRRSESLGFRCVIDEPK